MFNYFKFALFTVISIIMALPRLIKIKLHPNNYSKEYIFKPIHDITKNALSVANIDVTIKGYENIPSEPVLFVANHASMLDGFILISSVNRPMGCAIADEPVWKKMPIVKDWTSLIKCVYINRKNNREGIKSIVEASENIINGYSMGIFPEGDLTWVNDPNAIVSDFKGGALKIAYKAKCPIVPVVIKNSDNTYEGYQPIGKINSKPVEVEFLKPIYDHINDPKLKTTTLGENIKNDMIHQIELYKHAI